MNTDTLIARARSGELRALTALGKRLLVGEGVPQDAAEGLATLRAAADRDDGEAAAQLSVCAAWGVGQPRNLDHALDYLQHAARLGWPSAQCELQVLARQTGNDWQGLRRKIDVASLTAPPAIHIVSEQPRIITLEKFASAEECAWLIERGRPTLQRAAVYRGTANAQVANTRTNTETGFTLFNADVLLSLIRDRMSAVTRASTSFFEVTKLLHYEPGEQFGLHADFLQLNTPELVQEVQLRGQRAATFLVYLNDGYEGGETDFPRIGFRYKGNRGDALLFSNIDADGAPDYNTVHAGLPTVRGEKWLLSQWIRTRQVS